MSDGMYLAERWVPFAGSISDRARALQVAMLGPDGTPMRGRQAPDPADFDAWVAFRDESNRTLGAAMEGRADPSLTTVETVTIAGVTVHIASPKADHDPNRVLLEFHGGGFYAGAGEFSRLTGAMRAQQHGLRCYSVDYRKPPEHPFPAGAEDGVAVYRALLDEVSPGSISVGGASAGANLAAATVLMARDEGLPLPASVVLLTPGVDLTETGDSFTTNRGLDVWLPHPIPEACRLYAGAHPLDHPLVSPLFADYAPGFPPTLVQAGTRDLLLSNAVRMHRVLRRAGVAAELHVFEGMPHGGFGGAPEDAEMASEIKRFVAEHWC